MKRKFSILLLFFVVILSTQAQNTKAFNLSGKNNNLKKYDAGNDGFSLEITTSKFDLTSVATPLGDFVKLTGSKLLPVYQTVGKPDLPVYSKLIEVPLGAILLLKKFR